MNGPARVLMEVDRILRTEEDPETAAVLALARIESWLQMGDEEAASARAASLPPESGSEGGRG